MSLEATMLVLDNSSYSINGDYLPTRLAAQADAVHLLFNAKLNANPENEVGLMVMAGKAPEVLVTPTQDEGKLVAALHATTATGLADLSTAIQVAQLALKHRQNKNQRQRIVVFVGSPLAATPTAALVKLGKKMKKNNVAIDIVAFGSDGDVLPSFSLPSTSSALPDDKDSNETKLRALHEAVNASDNSHFLLVSPGPTLLLSDAIAQSSILRRTDDDGPGGAGGDGGDFGVDANMDPELAMALRMSLEEERARQAALAAPPAAAAPSVPLSTVPEVPAAASAPEEAVPLLADADMHDDDGDDDLARALALSRGDNVEMVGDGEEDEDAEIARAIALSMKEEEDQDDEKTTK